MFHFKEWLVLLPQYLRALDFTGFYIFFSQHLDSFFCNSAIRNWVKSKNETNHLDARDKKQFAINPTWKICKLHPWWSLSLWRRRPRIHFRALGDKSVRCANAPPRPPLTPADKPNWHSALKMAAQLPASGNRTWGTGLSSPTEDSGRPPSITRDIVDANVLGRPPSTTQRSCPLPKSGDFNDQQRPRITKIFGRPTSPRQWPGKILPLKTRGDLLFPVTWRNNASLKWQGEMWPHRDPERSLLQLIIGGEPLPQSLGTPLMTRDFAP